MRKRFETIKVTEKGGEDWRAFITCSDGTLRWELRGYGSTPGEAADDAYAAYRGDQWNMHGYTIESVCHDCKRKFETHEGWCYEGEYYCDACGYGRCLRVCPDCNRVCTVGKCDCNE